MMDLIIRYHSPGSFGKRVRGQPQGWPQCFSGVAFSTTSMQMFEKFVHHLSISHSILQHGNPLPAN